MAYGDFSNRFMRQGLILARLPGKRRCRQGSRREKRLNMKQGILQRSPSLKMTMAGLTGKLQKRYLRSLKNSVKPSERISLSNKCGKYWKPTAKIPLALIVIL